MREVSLHILDLARNSIEAGASSVRVTVVESAAEDRLTVQIEDDGRGMDAEMLERASDPFFTTRTTRRQGMGLSLFRAVCERCEGSMTLESEPGGGTRVSGWMRLSHLDRPPLGDVGAVVQGLACEWPRVRVCYEHRVGDRRFAVDLVELQDELGDVPVSSPVVLSWLADHVREQVACLGSTA